MSTQMNGGTPLYTVEQLELIRRLRNSGISKDDIINAFDSFDRLDRELGPVYNIPVTLALQAQALQLMALGIANPQTIQVNSNHLTSGGHIVPPVAHASVKPQPASVAQLVVPTAPIPPMNPVLKHSMSGPSLDSDNAASLAQMASSILKNGFQDSEVDSKEFLEFISKGDAACCDEIKSFAAKHNIKQQQIATLAGICQSYVSRYMKGDIYDMSERSRRAIQKWYLVYRKNPGTIAVAANAATLLLNATPGGQQTPKKFITPNSLDLAELASTAVAGSGDVNFPRRERFVFRPNHLEILERYFQDNNYPTYETREEIAKACNAVTESVAGRELTDREKVTAQIISNWFANKRKELKKLAREEGLMDVSMVPMRPRGHPSRLYSELALMQQYRGELNNAVTSSVMQSPESSSRDADAGEDATKEAHGQGSDACLNSEKCDEGDSQPSDDGMDEEESLHWSVEMAAVNQAILSLTGQQPIEVAPTTAERSDAEEASRQALNTPPPPTSTDMI